MTRKVITFVEKQLIKFDDDPERCRNLL